MFYIQDIEYILSFSICVFLIKFLVVFMLTSVPVVEGDWNGKIISTLVFSSANISGNLYFINALA